MSLGALGVFFKSLKSRPEEIAGVKSEDSFANRSTRKAEGLTPMDLINKRFAPTKFREGYSQSEVDNFLDKVILELKRLQAENKDLKRRRANTEIVIGPFREIVTVDEVVQQNFSLTKGSGYDTDEVDDFLDEIAIELRRLNSENQEIADQIVAPGAETA